jgi:hypothetical protein
MHVAILSESSADETALRILVDAVLGIKTTPIAMNLESRGWSSVRSILPTISDRVHFSGPVHELVLGHG